MVVREWHRLAWKLLIIVFQGYRHTVKPERDCCRF